MLILLINSQNILLSFLCPPWPVALQSPEANLSLHLTVSVHEEVQRTRWLSGRTEMGLQTCHGCLACLRVCLISSFLPVPRPLRLPAPMVCPGIQSSLLISYAWWDDTIWAYSQGAANSLKHLHQWTAPYFTCRLEEGNTYTMMFLGTYFIL